MELVYKSKKIKDPDMNLIDDVRETMFWLGGKNNSICDYIIKMNGVLYSVLQSMILDGRENIYGVPLSINGYKCYEDNDMEDGAYYVYKIKEGAKKTLKEWKRLLGKDLICNPEETIPIKLTPVKTLDGWFANQPLIYKLDLYNSMSGTITKYLK